MCGIAGVLHFDAERRADAATLDVMTDALAHRGPDGRGVHLDGPLGLGHRRLAVIDPSPAGAQPLANEDRTVWAVVNGELYGLEAQRAELEARGHRFRSRSDSELLVHLYEEHGDACVTHLRGMFAFALWDARRRRLLLGRDRFGQKPLVYRLGRRGVHFASEPKGILADPDVPRRPDLDALRAYLTWGYVPGPACAYEGLQRLPPAHTLAVEEDGASALVRYWSLERGPKLRLETAADERRAAEALRARLDEAVGLRLVADVPLGAFLSGGLDSSAVVGAMHALGGPGPGGDGAEGERALRTFTVGFAERAFDEREPARAMARHVGARHEDVVLSGASFADLERIAWAHDAPFADPSCLATFALARLARREVTVVLSGDGADELLLGYRRHLGAALAERAGALPWPAGALARAPFGAGAAAALARLAGRGDLAFELERARGRPGLTPAELYLARLEALSPKLEARVLGPALRDADGRPRGADPRAAYAALLASAPGETLAERGAHLDLLTYLPDDVLTKVDAATMAVGLECRAPFLDHPLAELAARLPADVLLRGLRGKHLLREAARERVPAPLLARPKAGFRVPLERWFRGGLARTLRDVLLDPGTLERGLVREDGVRRLLAEHAAGRADRERALFTLLMLEVWWRSAFEEV